MKDIEMKNQGNDEKGARAISVLRVPHPIVRAHVGAVAFLCWTTSSMDSSLRRQTGGVSDVGADAAVLMRLSESAESAVQDECLQR
jgi:hypothetical protein